MKYAIGLLFCVANICIARPPVSISGLLSSSDLQQASFKNSQKKKQKINVNAQLSQADLSSFVYPVSNSKKIMNVNALLSRNQLNSVIQYMYTKQQQVKHISGIISQQDINTSFAHTSKKRKPRVNLSGLIVQDYVDPDYQAAFKILNNKELQQEYDANLEAIQRSFKEYYLTQTSVGAQEKFVVPMPKICCPDSNQNYTLCQAEQ